MPRPSSRVVQTSLNYFSESEKWRDEILYLGTVGEKRRRAHAAEVLIRDIRGMEHDFKLDKHGFQLLKNESTIRSFDRDDRIREDYYPEVIELVKQCTGATLVQPTSHTVRRLSWDKVVELEKDLPDTAPSVDAGNARFVHCDVTESSARKRMLENFPQHAHKLDKCRWGIINVWRPFDYPVTRDALAFADARSIRDDELQEGTIIMSPRRDSVQDSDGTHEPSSGEAGSPHGPSRNNQTAPFKGFTFKYWQCAPPATPEQHKWYYASEMRPDEVLLLKIYDTKRSVADKVMHTSFSSENDFGPSRHSLEVRCFVMWEDQARN